ncbi:MAG: aminoacyl-tRNA hydrolase [Flavobacteriaceae bacterium]|nr:aminoacyl-tRNA hydrolase [Flavobacteriaceae bacterium]
MNKETLQREFNFKAIRSSGPGGQHANKVASKVVLTFNLENSKAFTKEEKELLFVKLETKLSKDNTLVLSVETTRSQHKNKDIVIDKLFKIISNALKTSKKRKATKPSKSSIEKRLRKKKKQAIKKFSRRNPNLD